MLLLAAVMDRGSVWLQLFFSLLMLDLLCEACHKVTFNVPQNLEIGRFIGKVNVKHCFKHDGIISTNNPNFTILEDGSLFTKSAVSLTSHENSITLFFKSIHDHEPKRIYVSLITYPQKAPEAKTRHIRETVLNRTKRRWAPVPTTIMENSLGPFPMQIQQLSSDMAIKYNLRYFITGPGVDEPPLNYFYIEEATGNLFVTCPIDREEYSEFQLICYAVTPEGYTPEIPLVHSIKIEDDNDNAPVFENNFYTFHVLENCRLGTFVGQVIATDKDEPHTLHSNVKYRIISPNHETPQEFVIDSDSGYITVASLHLDRETIPAYTLQIEAKDMGGEEFGLCTTTDVYIVVGDVNDNAPEVEQAMYVVEVYENTEHAEILCISVKDKDELGTSSWMGTFTITKGNEDEAFSIVADQEKNVGHLIVLKGLDYEKDEERRLEIVINNEAPYVLPPNLKALPTSMISVVIRVIDQDEGPVFEPCQYILIIKERLLAGTVVGSYQARDPETGKSDHLSYRIINDSCGWITIDNEGNLRTTYILDADAQFMEYSQCNVTVSATDQSGKTGTGTIVIKLMNENNNYPESTRQHYIMCKDKKPIYIKVSDTDLLHFTIPFYLEIEKPMDLTWTLMPNDDVSALLSSLEDIDFGNYNISLRIYDNGGNSRKNEITVHYCNCEIPSDCSEFSRNIVADSSLDTLEDRTVAESSFFGPWGIVGSVLGSLAVMSVGFGMPYGIWRHRRKPPMTRDVSDGADVAFENVTTSNTEGPGEELINLNIFPMTTVNASRSISTAEGKIGRQEDLAVGGVKHATSETTKGGRVNHVTGSLQDQEPTSWSSYKDLCSEWQHFTSSHLSEMVFLCGEDEEHNLVKEYVFPYNYEGKESPAGSLSTCTGESEEEQLDFLNQPEPPFRILAETFVKK